MAEDRDPTTKFRRKRAVSIAIDSLIEEAEFESVPTKKEPREFCAHCKALVPGERTVSGCLGKHSGPCGLPCLGGGVPVGRDFHCDQCAVCARPDEFPEGTNVP